MCMFDRMNPCRVCLNSLMSCERSSILDGSGYTF
jgi:hypothetical protein